MFIQYIYVCVCVCVCVCVDVCVFVCLCVCGCLCIVHICRQSSDVSPKVQWVSQIERSRSVIIMYYCNITTKMSVRYNVCARVCVCDNCTAINLPHITTLMYHFFLHQH